MVASTGISNPKEALITEVRGEFERIGARLHEMQTLIEQSQQEVKRLQQRSVDINTQVNRIEANFDNVPRTDIKTVYTSALDIKTRLLTMQGQLEKVQQDRSQLEQFSKTLNTILEHLQGINPQSMAPSGVQRPQGKTSTGQLTALNIIRIVEAQEAERQRLARQMHDGPAQSLTNFILQAEICQRLFDRNPDRAVEELGNLKTAASTTFQKVRDFIFDLRPMMLDDLGLAPTIRRYTTAFSEKNNIEVNLTLSGEEGRRMEPHAEVTMFRGLQEVLGYARDVCGSSRIDILLDVSGDAIKASLDFNGKSIEEADAIHGEDGGGSVPGSQTVKAFSLNMLRERIELVGGTVDAYGAEGEDNHVQIDIASHER